PAAGRFVTLAGSGARGRTRRRGRPGACGLRARPAGSGRATSRRSRSGTAGRRCRSGTACRRDRRCGVSEGPRALEARGLAKRYRDVVALSECSFQLPAHRIIALVGANGAGKSTLMSIAAGLLPATSGEVLAGGQRIDPHRRPRPADTAHRVAILAQDKPLYRAFTVADMLKFGQHTNRVWDQRRGGDWLGRFWGPVGGGGAPRAGRGGGLRGLPAPRG